MIRIFVFFALVLAAATGVALLIETPGSVMVSYGGFDYKVTLAMAVGLLAAMILGTMLIWTVIRLAFRLPSLISMSNRMRRRARGYSAVSRGMIAVGTGDRRVATRFAADAERLLGREPMTLLLKAQAAQLAGDRPAAEATFKRMLDNDETRILGLRGLFVEARRNGSEAARAYAEEAFRLSPAAPWAGEAVLEYRSADKDWRGAMKVVDDTASRRVIDRETSRKQKAALLAAEALDLDERAPDAAFTSATEALKLNPGLVPAAVLAARRLSGRGDYSKAVRLLEAAWKLGPHPDLAEAYLMVRQGDSSHDRLKRARALVRLVPSAREGKLALARALLDAREFTEARQELEALVLDLPTARVCRLMADLEEQETGNAGMIRKWLSRASYAPRDPAWVADGFVSDRWAPVSPVTGRIDAFVWMTPPQSIESKVRASIDADRHEPVVDPTPPAEPPQLIAADPVVAPSVVTVDAATKTEAVPPVAAAAAPIPDVPARNEGLSADPIVRPPDDPGPRVAAPRKGWRLFG